MEASASGYGAVPGRTRTGTPADGAAPPIGTGGR